jgi:hypothetical protein
MLNELDEALKLALYIGNVALGWLLIAFRQVDGEIRPVNQFAYSLKPGNMVVAVSPYPEHEISLRELSQRAPAFKI